MALLDLVGHAWARRRLARMRAVASAPAAAQRAVLARLLRRAARTDFGRTHGFAAVRDEAAFRAAVPLRDYAAASRWFLRAKAGEPDVSWPGTVHHFAMSSGTTSGEKFLPVSADTIRSARGAGLDALVPFLAARPDAPLAGGKLLFLGGSPALRRDGPSSVGDMTGILTRHAPRFAARRHLPGPEAAALSPWSAKLERTAFLSLEADVRVLAGLPSWTVLFAERVLELARQEGRRVERLDQLWPRLAVYLHGGMAFDPYRDRVRALLGPGPWCLDGYSASEGGMYAVQDREAPADMLPVADRGVYFELVPREELASRAPRRFPLAEAEPGVDYAVAVSTDSGIWAYLVGDVVRLTSTSPRRLVFVGRVAHTLNAFGEHVSGAEIDRAALGAAAACGARLREYAVAATYPDAARRAGRHVWYVEPDGPAPDPARFAREVDVRIALGNEDYATHRAEGFGVDGPVVRVVPRGTFYGWMRALGREGGQHKVPRVLSPQAEAGLLAHLARAVGPRTSDALR